MPTPPRRRWFALGERNPNSSQSKWVVVREAACFFTILMGAEIGMLIGRHHGLIIEGWFTGILVSLNALWAIGELVRRGP